MSEIDFVDTIVVRSTEKGTHTIKEFLKSMDWAGESFKKSQEAKLGKISGLKIQSAKGTTKIELGKMYKTKIPKVDGMYISVNRGTGLLKL